MIKYELCYQTESAIKVVECVSETAKFVVKKTEWGDRKRAKISDWLCYFDTFEDAKQFCVNRIERELADAERVLAGKKEKLKKAKRLELCK